MPFIIRYICGCSTYSKYYLSLFFRWLIYSFGYVADLIHHLLACLSTYYLTHSWKHENQISTTYFIENDN